MKRIDRIYNELNELYKGEGISASELSSLLGFTRSNVSFDLNKLCKEGKVKKSNTRPVLFYPLENKGELENEETTIDKLIKGNVSLITAAEQAKAAILYPPKGMHTLILGETGVGKTMFASIMHRYAVEMKKMKDNSPFITFNCADYSNNPQLLLSQIFGVKKGAYTGANEDKKGLIEKANGGIIFLDEVHRLPCEGQEMFFTFMDKGIFRRLGETDIDRSANVLIIAATTENPDSSLLKTFTRRIPMTIKIPSLKDRGIEERFNLIKNFFIEESFRLDKEITVSLNVIKLFLSYTCSNNVGQLKTDIQLCCAKAYADFVSEKKDCIKINSCDLNTNISNDTYISKEQEEIINKLIGIKRGYFVFNKYQDMFKLENEKGIENIYELIDSKIIELKSKGLNSEEVEKIMEEDIQSYFTQYLYKVNKGINNNNLKNIIDSSIIQVVEEIIKYSEKSLNKIFSQQVYLGIALHISALVERVKRNKKIINPQLNNIKNKYKKEFEVALKCLKIIEKTINITLPLDEAGFICMFFVLEKEKKDISSENTGIIVIMHGISSATSMCEVANKLLGIEYAVGIDVPIEIKAQDMLIKVKQYISRCTKHKEFLFLVDMGSLTSFGDLIQDEISIPIKTIPFASTPHVLEATRKAILGYNLNQIYKEVININSYEEIEVKEDIKIIKKIGILTVCLTGEGSAIAIKNFLENHLQYDNNIFEIIPINLIGEEDINNKIKKLNKTLDIMCIISSFDIDVDIKKYTLQEILNLRAIKEIQNDIDVQTLYLNMGKNIKYNLKNINEEIVFEDIRKLIFNIKNEMNISISIDALIGLSLHMACMINRLIEKEPYQSYIDKEKYIFENHDLYLFIKKHVYFLEEKYKICICDSEICYIMKFFH